MIFFLPFYFEFFPKNSSEYFCPRCKSNNIDVFGDLLKCFHCGLTFSIDIINSDIEDQFIFAEEELKTIIHAFKEFHREQSRRSFKKSLDDDFLDD